MLRKLFSSAREVIMASSKEQQEDVVKALGRALNVISTIKQLLTDVKNNKAVYTKAQLELLKRHLNSTISALQAPAINYKNKENLLSRVTALRDAFDGLDEGTPLADIKLEHLPELNALIGELEKRIPKDEEKLKKISNDFSTSEFMANPLFYTGRYLTSFVLNENISYYIGPVLGTLFLSSIAYSWLISPLVGAPMPIQAASSVLNGTAQAAGYFGTAFSYIGSAVSPIASWISSTTGLGKLIATAYEYEKVAYVLNGLGSGMSTFASIFVSAGSLITNALQAASTLPMLLWYVGVPYAGLRVASAFFEVLGQAQKLIAPAIQGVKDSISIIAKGIASIGSIFGFGVSVLGGIANGFKSLWNVTETPRNYASFFANKYAPSGKSIKAAAANAAYFPVKVAANTASTTWAYTGQPVSNKVVYPMYTASKNAMTHAYNSCRRSVPVAQRVTVSPPSPRKPTV